MSKKIFLAGATGNIGTHVIHYLQERKVEFTIGVTSENPKWENYNTSIIDFADKQSMIKALEGVETLFILFPLIDGVQAFAKNSLEAAQESGVKNIIRSSAAGADINSDYAALKLHGAIDNWFIESGINYTITRPLSFMQNFINFLGYPIKSGQVYYSTGEGKSAWVDTRDIAAVNAEIIENPLTHVNSIYTIAGSESFDLPEGVNRIAKRLAKPIATIPISHQQADETLKNYGFSDFQIRLIGSIEKATMDGVLADTSDDVERILGRPPIRFDEFIKDHLEAWK